MKVDPVARHRSGASVCTGRSAGSDPGVLESAYAAKFLAPGKASKALSKSAQDESAVLGGEEGRKRRPSIRPAPSVLIETSSGASPPCTVATSDESVEPSLIFTRRAPPLNGPDLSESRTAVSLSGGTAARNFSLNRSCTSPSGAAPLRKSRTQRSCLPDAVSGTATVGVAVPGALGWRAAAPNVANNPMAQRTTPRRSMLVMVDSQMTGKVPAHKRVRRGPRYPNSGCPYR